jgi:hypothetical protein
MWMYDHFHLRKFDKSFKYRFLFGWNCLVIAIGTMLMVAGTYGSIVDIIDAYHKNGGTTVSPPSLAACPLHIVCASITAHVLTFALPPSSRSRARTTRSRCGAQKPVRRR